MAFKKLFTKDSTLQEIQDNIEDAFRPIQNSPMVRPVLVESINLVTGQDNLVSHGLNGTPKFWIVAGQNANAVLWSQPSSQLRNKSSNERLINIRCSANCIVNILFG
jgi:hypothetical protein